MIEHVSDKYKKFVIPAAAAAGSLTVLAVGRKSILNAVKVLEKNYMENVKPEYFSYLNSEELVSVTKLLNKGLSETDLNMFSRIWKIQDKKQFADEALNILTVNFGDKKRYLKPDLTFEDDFNNDGSWSDLAFKINIANFENLSKVSILKVLKHEFEHYIQSIKMLRTEGIGVDVIIDSKIEKLYNVLKNKEDFSKKYTDDELKQIAAYSFNKDKELLKIREELAKLIFGEIPKDSPEGRKAFEYFEASKKYVHVDRSSSNKDYEKYRNNLLEIEAFNTENIFFQKYEDFIMTLLENKKLI